MAERLFSCCSYPSDRCLSSGTRDRLVPWFHGSSGGPGRTSPTPGRRPKKKASVADKACPSMGASNQGNARRLKADGQTRRAGNTSPCPRGPAPSAPCLRAFPRFKVPIDGHALSTTEAKKKGERPERRNQTNRAERGGDRSPLARPARCAWVRLSGASPWFEVCLPPPGNPGGMKGGRRRKAGALPSPTKAWIEG